jgi:hypothetical protein
MRNAIIKRAVPLKDKSGRGTMVSTEDDEPAEGKGAKIALRQLVKDAAG